MEKHIVAWSYWLGLLSAVIAFVLRALSALRIQIPIGYMTFFKGALLLFMIAIATTNYTRERVPKP